MPMRNPALFARIFNTPLMIHSMKLDAIIAGIGQRFGIDAPKPDMALVATGENKTPGYQVIGGIAVIDVFGVLAHRESFEADCSYILGYDRIGKQINAAVADADVKGILLQMDSPGGEVSGAFELAAQIREAGAIKPIKAAISSLSASANYLMASATQEIVITDTGMAGSIGVVMRHVDISKMAANEGISVTHIYAGAQKIDGNQFEPLSPKVKARFQSEIDSLYTLFVNTVSQYRDLDAAAIRDQEAGIFTGQDAIKAGLADRIATPDQLLAEMQQNSSHSTGVISMSTQKPEAGADAAALEKSRAAGFEAGKQEGLTAGASAERNRISAILNHEAAQGREAQAKALALDTDLAPEAAAKVLAVSPKVETPKAEGDQFSKHMAKLSNPDVDADADDEPTAASATQGWNQAFSKVAVLRGGKR
jgi:signal peptide peptidase SppA